MARAQSSRTTRRAPRSHVSSREMRRSCRALCLPVDAQRRVARTVLAQRVRLGADAREPQRRPAQLAAVRERQQPSDLALPAHLRVDAHHLRVEQRPLRPGEAPGAEHAHDERRHRVRAAPAAGERVAPAVAAARGHRASRSRSGASDERRVERLAQRPARSALGPRRSASTSTGEGAPCTSSGGQVRSASSGTARRPRAVEQRTRPRAAASAASATQASQQRAPPSRRGPA